MSFGELSRRGKTLLFLIFLQIIVTIIYKLFFETEELFFVALASGIGVILYASTIRCRVCGKSQVFTGLSFFDLRLPKKKCHNCKSSID